MLTEIITQSSTALEAAFQAEEINQLARDTKLVQRKSLMDGWHLLKTLTMGYLEKPNASLADLRETSADLGVEITRQGIDERLNEAGVSFLEKCFARILGHLQAKQGLIPEVLKAFTEVYLHDSTIQSLPESLEEQFRGSGGNASSAAVKIQVMFGLLRGNLAHVALQAGNAPDTRYGEHVEDMLPGSLLIQDLGFFNMETFQAVVAREAFFLSRWRSDVLIYLADQPDQALDMLKFLSKQTEALAEYSVQVGKTAHLPCRMVVLHLPQEVAEKRRRRLREDAKRRGTTPSERSLALCAWSIFLTNLPPERLSLRQLLACYNLRWQIELIFKLWKSQAGLKSIAGKRRERVLCELYARLIGIVLSHFLLAPLRFQGIAQNIEISLSKAFTILQHAVGKFFPHIGLDALALRQKLATLFGRILRGARKSRRGKKLTSLQRLILADQIEFSSLFA